MALRSVLALLCVAVVAAEATKAKVTPIEKVTQLLKGLQAKVAEEGKKEAAAYDKYACFCKEQADGKLYNIEKSNDKISKLTEEIKSLDADISELNGDISQQSTQISGLEKTISDDDDERTKDHAKYLAKAKDLSEAIGACEAAIAAMKDAKGGLSDAKVNLVQVQSRLFATASTQNVPARSMDLLQQLTKLTGGPAKYAFQGNDIIAVLEDLLADFKKSKADMDKDEFDVNSVFEKKALGDTNEKKFAQAEKDEKSALSEEKSEAMMDAKENNDEEKNDRAADQSFLDTLTAECEAKAKLFDQRSSTRADELTAMTKAIDALKDTADNEGANKKLTGLVQGDVAPSFVQINRNSRSSVRTLQQDSNLAVKRVLQLIQDAASRLDSKVLQGAAARVQLSADHFVKVRGLIKDLIKKLEADAKSEAKQKGFCDKAMSAAIKDRDDGKSKEEAANAKLTTLTALKEDLTNDIGELGEGIAANKKALNEATELRNEEKGDNEATVDSAKDGLQATNLALTVLKDFYKSAFLQTSSSKYTPPKSDREGNTVGDLAPDTFDEEYQGAGGESKGIMGILEVIVSDFDRTIKTVSADEKTAQDAFDKMEKESNDDTKAKQDSSDKKDGQLKKAESDILGQQQALKDATDLFDAGVEKLDDLKSMCVEGEETWEERAAARKKEIEALKDAQKVLDEWQA